MMICVKERDAYVCTKERTRKVKGDVVGRAGKAIAEEEKMKMKMEVKRKHN